MTANPRVQLLADLEASREALGALLESLAEAPDWRPDPGEWSLREIAAHLAAVEKECFQDRVERISTGKRPHFDYYDNTGRDFGQADLRESLRDWAATRREIIAFARALPEKCWGFSGTHSNYGILTLSAALRVMLNHDREHLAHLQAAVEKSRQGDRGAAT